MATSSSAPTPKAILYSWRTSVWASIPLLCLFEKGYSEDEYIVKEVDITKGENFSPAYLKINANGTVPTLVVPTAETVGDGGSGVRYRSLRDTMTISEFLDHARSAQTTATTSKAPAPALAPATIEGKTLSDSLTALVHLPTVDPNFLYLSARNAAELREKSSGEAGDFVRNRQAAIKTYIAEAEEEFRAKVASLNGSSPTPPNGNGDLTPNGHGDRSGSGSSSEGSGSGSGSKKGDTGLPKTGSLDHAAGRHSPTGMDSDAVKVSPAAVHAGAAFEHKTLQFLQAKQEANTLLFEIYSGKEEEDKLQGFYDASNKAWKQSLPEVLTKLEAAMVGPFALGDQISLADIHIIAWLSRLVYIATGRFDEDGMDKLAKYTGSDFVPGDKVKAFWDGWRARASFDHVFVTRYIKHETVADQ